jgi:murein DD-endopeptidase MepM/ murein hydrolase activator NlpD
MVGLGVVVIALGVLWPRVQRVSSNEEVLPTDELLLLRAPEITGLTDAPEIDDGFDASALAVPSSPTYVEGAIARGQSLTVAARELGVAPEALAPVVRSLEGIFDFRRSQVGDRFEIELLATGEITSLRYIVSPEVRFEAQRIGEGRYESRAVEVALDAHTEVVVGTISGSFYATVAALGEGEALARKVVEIFQWDIDFSRDVRPGDAFRLLVEKLYLDGEFLRYGNILAAEYSGTRVTRTAYHFDDPDHEGYYTPEGVPMERMFLAAPCRYRRISSRFDLERMHPVMNRRVPHLGVDYAADTGTPVWAAASGVVTHRGYNARAGNMVKIRHPGGYETAYAHLSRFASGLRDGQRVEQGQVIGFVGSTGMSTGPHLHYGMRLNGEHVDPLGRQWNRGTPLSGRALDDFRRRMSQLDAELSTVPMPAVEVAEVEEEPAELPTEPLDIPLDGDLSLFDALGY